MAKSKKTPDRLKIIEETIAECGKDKEAIANAKIGKQTFYKWINTDRDFANLVAGAHKRFENLNLRNRLDLREKAVESLEWLLSKKEIKKDEVTIIKQFDKEGQALGHNEITKRKTVTRDPSFAVIEKVLGRREIEYIVLNKAINEGKEDPNAPLFKRLFGDWGHDELTEHMEENIFSDSIDLIKLRQIQAETQKRFDQGLLPFEEYEKMVQDQSKSYITLKDKIERRAMGLVEGYSPQELILQIRQFTHMLLTQLDETVNDLGIDRADIPAELSRKIKARTEIPATI